MGITVVAGALAVVCRFGTAVLPQLHEGVRRLQHGHSRGRPGQANRLIGERIVAIPIAFLNHFESEQIPVELKPPFEIGDADCHVMDAYDHRCSLLAQRPFGGLASLAEFRTSETPTNPR